MFNRMRRVLPYLCRRPHTFRAFLSTFMFINIDFLQGVCRFNVCPTD